jgi:hypothetical protein
MYPAPLRNGAARPVIRDAEPHELMLLQSHYRTLRLVDLESQLHCQEPTHPGREAGILEMFDVALEIGIRFYSGPYLFSNADAGPMSLT